jgi:hypothetical protein
LQSIRGAPACAPQQVYIQPPAAHRKATITYYIHNTYYVYISQQLHQTLHSRHGSIHTSRTRSLTIAWGRSCLRRSPPPPACC